jgi:hypothetical protein
MASSPFVDWKNPLQAGWSVSVEGMAGDYTLNTGVGAGAEAVDSGSNSLYPDTWIKWQGLVNPPVITEGIYNAHVLPTLSKDAGGNSRLYGVVDMGAYERQD